MYSPIERFDIISFASWEVLGFDLSFTNFALYLIFFFTTFILLFVYFLKNSFLPNFLQLLMEGFLKFIFDIVNKQIGVKGFIFFPFFVILFFLILFLNLYGLAPCSFSPTAHIIYTFFLSGIIWFSAVFLGFLENGLGFYRLFVPNVPAALLPFLVVLEIFSYIIRLFSLAIRLAANITAGHVLMFTLAGFSVNLAAVNILVFGVTLIVLSLVFLLELGVAFLQAYVFVTLSCMYFNDSLNLSH